MEFSREYIPLPCSPRQTMRLPEQEIIKEIEENKKQSKVENFAAKTLKEKIKKTEQSIWMIDKKYQNLIKAKWEEFYKLEKEIRELENL